jgi:hypothetical protein
LVKKTQRKYYFVIYGSLQYGTFGYNCGLGQCDFLTTPDFDNFPQTYFVAVAYYLPCILIVASYSIIWWEALTF